MALTKQELKEVFKIVNSIKNSGMNPWGNLKRGKDMTLSSPRKKKVIFNKEDATELPKEEKFKNNK
jgi:hypothetical protein